jgi:hypothetical protein
MATTNLKKKTLGRIKVSSGVGTPDHVDEGGSLYINSELSSISKYVNSDIDDVWEVIPRGCYAAGNTTGTTAQVISSVGAWIAMSGSSYSWVGGAVSGFSQNQGVFTVLDGGAGFYSIDGFCYLNYNTTINEYEFGISVNSANPIARERYGVSVDNTTFSLNRTVSFNIHRRFEVGDVIVTAIRGITTTSTVNIKRVGITFQRIYD